MGKRRLTSFIMLGVATVALAAAACGGDGGDSAEPAPTAGEAGSTVAVVDSSEAATAQHHYQALLALRDGAVDDAAHHVEHIIESVAGDHRQAMQGVLGELQAGNAHDAEHAIEAMLVGNADVNLSAEVLQLQLSLDALSLQDGAAAVHRIEHYADLVAGEAAHEAESILELVGAGAFADAEAALVAEINLRTGDAEHDSDEADHDAGEQAEHEDAAADDDHDAAEPAHEDDADAHEDGGDVLDADNARVVLIAMTDFFFIPTEIRVKQGETIRLVIANGGQVLHDITSLGFQGDAEASGSVTHEGSTAHGHDDSPTFHAAAESGGTVELLFVASEVGEFDLFCSVPGHKELGMTATLIVEPA